MSWLRVDTDIFENPKLYGCPHGAHGLYIKILCVMQSSSERSSLSPSYWDAGYWAERCKVEKKDVIEWLAILESRGVIEHDGERLRVHNWREYQPDPTARVRKAEQREREKAEETSHESHGDNCDMPMSRHLPTYLPTYLPDQTNKTEKGEEEKKIPPTPRKRGGIVYTSEFEDFWASYPWKNGKAKAAKAWMKNDPPRPSIDQILISLEALKRGRDWMKEDGKYIPLPATWINSGGWDNVPRTPISPGLSHENETPGQRAWREQREQAARWLREAEEKENANADRKNDGSNHHDLLGGVREVQNDRASPESLADDDGRHTG